MKIKDIAFGLVLCYFLIAAVGAKAQQTVTGFYEGEQISGLNKICFYSSVRGRFTHMTSATSICPLSMIFVVP